MLLYILLHKLNSTANTGHLSTKQVSNLDTTKLDFLNPNANANYSNTLQEVIYNCLPTVLRIFESTIKGLN